MTNNYILRRLRYTFDLSDSQMITLFGLADMSVTREDVSAWLKKDEDPALIRLTDNQMATFLNGFIVEKRGKRDGPQPVAEHQINNNIIFRKLKIALNLIDQDILDLLRSANFIMSKPELSALFRKPDHRSYRECQDQILRNFIKGIQLKYHAGSSNTKADESDTEKPAPKVTATPDKTQEAIKRQNEVKEYLESKEENEALSPNTETKIEVKKEDESQASSPKKGAGFQWQPVNKK
ncbi:MAG: DUF1456 family protein [Bermanella sp.]